MLLCIAIRAQKEQNCLLVGHDLLGVGNRAAFTLYRGEFDPLQRKAKQLLYRPPASPLETQTEDADQTGQDAQSYHGVAVFHAAGTADVAQGGLTAAGSNTGYANVQVN